MLVVGRADEEKFSQLGKIGLSTIRKVGAPVDRLLSSSAAITADAYGVEKDTVHFF